MLVKFGAKIWIPRIMITWGLASMAMVFISGPYSLYLLRALLGAAEAGMLPGVLFFMSSWFPGASRARANSLFLAAAPIGLVLGALLAGPILQMDGMLGLQGWQWLFLLEGFPTVLLGILAYFLLVDKPDQAKWLTSDEKQAIKASLERSEPVQAHAKGTWRGAITKNVLVLAAIIYCNQTSTSILASWTPLIVRDAVGSGSDVLLITLLSALPALTAIISMFVIGTLSDRHAERSFYTAGGLVMAGIGWGVCLLAPFPALKILGLCLAAGGAFGSLVPFWAWVPELIGREGRAVAVAAITSLATIASVATPIIVGFLRDLTDTFNSSIAFALAAIALSVAILMSQRTPGRTA